MEMTAVVTRKNLESLEEKINKWNKRSKKTGVSPIVLKVLESWVEPKERKVEGETVTYLIHWRKIVLNGERPQIKGYRFVSAIEHLTEGANILRTIEGEEVPAHYRTARGNCDHCKINRYRKHTVIIQKAETGEYIQIGKSCLSDFLPNQNVEEVAKYFEYLSTLSDELRRVDGGEPDEDDGYESGMGGGGKREFYLPDFLTVCAELVLRGGYTKASKEGYDFRLSTGDRAWNFLVDKSDYNKPSKDPLEITKFNPLNKEMSQEFGERVLKWVLTLDGNNDLSEYEHNILTIAKYQAVEWKNRNIAASMFAAYQRAQDRLQDMKEEDRKANTSEHIGQPKERIAIKNAKVVKIVKNEGTYGVSHIHTIEDEKGNVFVWFCTGIPLEEGAIYDELRGTVKKHVEFRGIKQTVLSRVS